MFSFHFELATKLEYKLQPSGLIARLLWFPVRKRQNGLQWSTLFEQFHYICKDFGYHKLGPLFTLQ
jgi:hypothetical protein